MGKYVIGSIALLFMYACSVKNVNTQKEKYSFKDVAQEVGDAHKDIIDDIKAHYQASFAGVPTKAIDASPFKSFFMRMDEYKYYSMPIYTFDLFKFSRNPSEANIHACIMPTDVVNMLAEKDGKIEMGFTTKKNEKTNKWQSMTTTLDYGDVIGWLPDSLGNANTDEYKIFLVAGKEWVTYQKNDKHLYFKITGQEIPAAYFCRFAMNEYNRLSEVPKP